MITFQEYLIREGVDPSDSEQKVRARKAYRKIYMRWYRSNRKEVKLLFSPKDYSAVEQLALQSEVKVATLCLQLIQSQLVSQKFNPPEVKDWMKEVTILLRRYGTLHNQILRHVHTDGSVKRADVDKLNQNLKAVEKKLQQAIQLFIKTIYDPFEILSRLVKKYPKLKVKLLKFLQSL